MNAEKLIKKSNKTQSIEMMEASFDLSKRKIGKKVDKSNKKEYGIVDFLDKLSSTFISLYSSHASNDLKLVSCGRYAFMDTLTFTFNGLNGEIIGMNIIPYGNDLGLSIVEITFDSPQDDGDETYKYEYCNNLNLHKEESWLKLNKLAIEGNNGYRYE